MKRFVTLWMACTLLGGAARGAIAPAEQLLPADTLAMVAVPAWDKAAAAFNDSPYGRLLADPVFKPFKDHFIKKFSEEMIRPLETQFGVKFAEYRDLARGQVTVALTQNGWDGKSDSIPGFVLLLDAREQKEVLKTKLAELKKKWTDAGKPLKTSKIRDVEFTTIVIDQKELDDALSKAFPDDGEEGDKEAEEKPAKPVRHEIAIGQSDSLLIVGNTPKDLEKVVARLGGGNVPALADQAPFQASRNGLFREALAFGWVHVQPIYDVFAREAADANRAGPRDNPFAPRMDKILTATGLGGLKTAAFKVSNAPEGTFTEVLLAVPENGRQGIFKAVAMDSRDSTPPAFVPAETVKFSRWRLDGQKMWASLESMLTAVSPEMAGLIQMGLATVGKDKDPNFDLKKMLIGNLGDDIVSYEKKPRSNSPADLNNPPAITLVGSPNAEALATALKASTALLPMGGMEATIREREFQGKRIYSVPLPENPEEAGGKAAKREFSFAASRGYVALSADAGMIEEFLRSNEGAGRPLRETAGLADAAQKSGGMSTGFFGYENQLEGMRTLFTVLKSDSEALDKMLSNNRLPGAPGAEEARNLKGWFDFSLLPPFDQVSRYFHFMVYTFATTRDGLHWKLFSPTPPQMKK